MKIGFFLENQYYNNVDFSHPELGNPGIRGTQYMMWIIACKLSEFHEVYIFAPCIDKMATCLHSYICKTDQEAVLHAQELGIEILVLRASNDKVDDLKKSDFGKMKVILWSHNFENYDLVNVVAQKQQIKRHVCVGRQQYERLRDHSIFKKSTYIYNALDFSILERERELKNQKIVTYVGALNDLKGFHVLAKAWKHISKLVPDAELYVLGSGDMGKGTKLGKYGLADEKYEKKFIPYLVDNNGDFIPSVHFMGNVGGVDKENIMLNTTVGVANPTGVGETFCIVATEFEALGVPVVSKKGYGLLDTVLDKKTGLLVKDEKELVSAIVQLLNDTEMNVRLGSNGYRFVRNNFSIDKVVEEWRKLINSVEKDEKQQICCDYDYPRNQYKWLREINRKLQINGIRVPSLLMWEYIKPLTMKCLVQCKKLIIG